jgi:hypothetical protein
VLGIPISDDCYNHHATRDTSKVTSGTPSTLTRQIEARKVKYFKSGGIFLQCLGDYDNNDV